MVQIRENEIRLCDGVIDNVIPHLPSVIDPIIDNNSQNTNNDEEFYNKSIRVFLESALREVTLIRLKFGVGNTPKEEPKEEIKHMYPTDSITPNKFLFYLLFGVDYTEKVLSKIIVRFSVFRKIVQEEYARIGKYEFNEVRLKELFTGMTSDERYSIFDSKINDNKFKKVVKAYYKAFKIFVDAYKSDTEDLHTLFFENIDKMSTIDTESFNLFNNHLFDIFNSPDYIVNNYEFITAFLICVGIMVEISTRFFDLGGIDPNAWVIPTDTYLKEVFAVDGVERSPIVYGNYDGVEDVIHLFSPDKQTMFIMYPKGTPEDKISDNFKLFSRDNSFYYKRFDSVIVDRYGGKYSSFVLKLEDGRHFLNGDKEILIEDSVEIKEYIEGINYHCFIYEATNKKTRVKVIFKNDILIEENQRTWLKSVANKINDLEYTIKFENMTNFTPDELFRGFVCIKEGSNKIFATGLNSNERFFSFQMTHIYHSGLDLTTIDPVSENYSIRQIILTDDYLLFILTGNEDYNMIYQGTMKFENELLIENTSDHYGTRTRKAAIDEGYSINKVYNLEGKTLLIEYVDDLEIPTVIKYLYEDYIRVNTDEEGAPEINTGISLGYEFKAKKVFTTYYQSFILTDLDILYGCGANAYGELGLGFKSPRPDRAVPTFTRIELNHLSTMNKITKIVSTNKSILIMDSIGQLFASGSASNGCTGLASDVLEFTQVNLGYRIKDIAACGNSVAILDLNGVIKVAGYNNKGNMGRGTIKTVQKSFVDITQPIPEPVKSIAATWDTLFAISESGNMYATGVNGGLFGNGSNSDSNVFIKVTGTLLSNKIRKVYPSWSTTMVETIDDEFYVTGSNEEGMYGAGEHVTFFNTFICIKEAGLDLEYFYGEDHAFIKLFYENQYFLYGFGDNEYGALGKIPLSQGIHFTKTLLYEGAFVENIQTISNFSFWSLILTKDGRVFYTGYGEDGSLGNGSFDSVYEYTEVNFDEFDHNGWVPPIFTPEDGERPIFNSESMNTVMRNYQLFGNKSDMDRIIKVARSENSLAVLLNNGLVAYLGEHIFNENTYAKKLAPLPGLATNDYNYESEKDIVFIGNEKIDATVSNIGYHYFKEAGQTIGQVISPVNTNILFVQFWNLFHHNPTRSISEQIQTNKQFMEYLKRNFSEQLGEYIFDSIIDTSITSDKLMANQMIDSVQARDNRSMHNTYKYNEFLNILNINYLSHQIDNNDTKIVKLIKFFVYIALYAENLTAVRNAGKGEWDFYHINYPLPFDEKNYIDRIVKIK